MSKNPLDVIKDNDSTLFDAMTNAREICFTDGALSIKDKLLIAIAIDACKGAENGVRNLTVMAKEAGATNDEIMETLRVVNYICGVGSMYTAANALQDVL